MSMPTVNLSSHSPRLVFEGDQRAKAIVMLSSAIAEHRQSAVLQLIAKDPSLAFEMVRDPGCLNTNNEEASVEFPLACLRAGLSAGYLAAIHHGFPINAKLQGGRTSLLQTALEMAGQHQHVDADVSLLLSLGANPQEMPVRAQSLYGAFSGSFPVRDHAHRPAVINLLLDAKTDFSYDAKLMCPYCVLIRSGGWDKDESRAQLVRMMARLRKAGLDINATSGTPPLSPLVLALGAKNTEGLVALIRLGANVDVKTPSGVDLLSALDSDKTLLASKPRILEAMLEARLNSGTSTYNKDTVNVAPNDDQRRRRINRLL